jgi:ammonia channel protein AmtB
VYPVVAYWSWDASGWLSAANPNAILNTGAIDFAGSGGKEAASVPWSLRKGHV